MERKVTAFPAGGFSLDATLNTADGEDFVVFAMVYSEDRTEFLGLVQRARDDGSEWMVSLGDGWLPALPRSLYDALDFLGKVHASFAGRRV